VIVLAIQILNNEQAVQDLFFEAWAESYEEIIGRKPAPKDIFPTRADRGTTFFETFGAGQSELHVNIRPSSEGAGDRPVAVQAVTDYGDFYAGGGARSVANPQLFSKDKVPSRSVDGIKINGGWSEIYEGVMNKYTDKPMILSIANKELIPKWRGLGFKPYNEETANLPEAVKEKLKGLKYPIYYRDSGEMKKSFAYVWAKYIHKCDL
tara:strand:+ start:820 stop:1443 length:624 start_codon:yes stop_codon:yes gene_type:complete